MNRTLLIAAIAFLVGGAVGAAAMLIVYPFLFPPAEVNESVLNAQSKTVTATGAFIHPNPNDPVHWGKGGVTVYQSADQQEVFLQPDFEVGPGPDYFLYLAKAVDIRSNEDFEQSDMLQIGRLKSFKGGQVYRLEPGVDSNAMGSVVVWCKTFGALITSANLVWK